jgi:hypothetical protein
VPTSPTNNSYVDVAAGFTAAWTFVSQGGGTTQTAFAFRRKVVGAGSYEYWNAATQAWQATIVWNSSTTNTAAFPSGAWSSTTSYLWSVAVQDANGQGVFATDQTLNGNAPPSTPTGLASQSAGVLVLWNFADINSGDSQSRVDIRYRPSGGGGTPGSGAWTTQSPALTGAANATVIPMSSLTLGIQYEWEAQTYDSHGLPSGWSPSAYFMPIYGQDIVMVV